ncbi:MAG: sodium-dependent transporter [Endomicrobiaceae bacterium]
MNKQRPQWSSRFIFILATVGSTVGLGNIWRFPYLMGENGGAAFLLIYLLMICFICAVPLIAELAIGKYIQKDVVSIYESISPKTKIFGWSNIITSVVIASFYFVVGGWIINYIINSFLSDKITDYSSYFSDFASSNGLPAILTVLFLFICIFFTSRGVNRGIEVANKIMMPVFVFILIVLTVVSLSLPNAKAGIDFMFKVDFSKVTPNIFLLALGQALFTLSVGIGALIVYGSYLRKEDNIVKNAYIIIFFDTAVAIIAGLMIFPAVFSFGLAPDSGAGLVFITLPKIFAQIPFGNLVAFAFFILLLFAALTSGVSITEVPVASLTERLKISRRKASLILFIIIALFAIPVSLSFGILKDLTLGGKNLFDIFDFASSNILLPLNSLAVCITVGWILKLPEKFIVENKFAGKIFYFAIKFVLPVLLTLLIIIGLF